MHDAAPWKCRSVPCGQYEAVKLLSHAREGMAGLQPNHLTLRISQKSLELELQSELRQPRITDVQHLSKRGALIGDVAIHGIELRMVPDVEEIRAEFHP